MEKSKRIKYFDNIKGLLIFLVVFSHFLYEFRGNIVLENIVKIVYIFHMPFFIFISGYFSKNNNSTSKDSICKLLFYYIVGNTLLMWFSFFMYNTPFNLVEPYYSFWFLLALIFYRIIIKYIKNFRFIFPISIFVALMIGGFREINNAFALSRIICFFPFFLAGYKLDKNYVNKFLDKRNLFNYVLGIVLIFSLLCSAIIFVPYISMDDLLMNPYTINCSIIYRGILFFMAFLFILGIILIIPNKRYPFISSWGEKSLYIFLYHRFFILLLVLFISTRESNLFYIIVSFVLSFIICLIFSSDWIARFTNNCYEKVKDIFSEKKITTSKVVICECVVIVLIFTLIYPMLNVVKNISKSNKIYKVMTTEEKNKIDNDTISVLFTGDLILLKDQVERGYIGNGKYDFNSVFDYTKKYIEKADISVGVFEGVMAGKERGYSNSNFDDGVKMKLNFPDEFGEAIKNAGFDLVTLSNNHLLDKGKSGVYNTVEKLDKLGIRYTGVNYKNNTNVIEKDGLRIGVLAYTYGLNYYNEDKLMTQYITSGLVDKNSKYFKEVKNKVKEDFKRLKSSDVDVILVLPHMGTQFSHSTDDFQNTWNDIFVEYGADMIIGDHSHSVQPIEFRKNKDGNNVIIVNSLGNFVNSYTKHNGDASSMIEVYLDKNNGQVIGSSIIPMWIRSSVNGNYQALPVYEILNNEYLKNNISTYELKRVEKAYKLETGVMLNKELSLNNVEEKLYLDEEDYKRKKVNPINISAEDKNKNLYKKITKANSVCIIGDSISEGSKNGGYGWFEPLINAFDEKRVINISKGGATVKSITNIYNKEKCDLYIIEIGTNDVRYRDSSKCAMDEVEYIEDLKLLVDKIPNSNEKDFVFIAPWLSLDNDPWIRDVKEKNKLLTKYRKSLKKFCLENNYLYIDPNSRIEDAFKKNSPSKYLVDHIHPNSKEGIYLYSRAVMDASS